VKPVGLEGLGLSDLARRDWVRNIISLRRSEDLYDDIADDDEASSVAVAAELAAKPSAYHSRTPIVGRPFEEADYFNAVRFPFERWSESRFSTGQWGVWYGAETLLTGACETVYHWLQTIADARDLPMPEQIVSHRRVYAVRCIAALLDLRPMIANEPLLVDPVNFAYTRALGEQLVREKQPGLISQSARGPDAIAAVFTPDILTNPRHKCFLTYRLQTASGEIRIERGAKLLWTVKLAGTGRVVRARS
jgi:hypothetical protein